MNNRFAAALFLTLCVPSARAEKEPFKTMHVAELAKALASATPPVVYDVNVASTRENVGIIPGAKLLSSSSKYDVAKELPADKKRRSSFTAPTRCARLRTPPPKRRSRPAMST